MREFVPHLIGTANTIASFPFPTIVCEKTSFEGDAAQADLFSDISVGFNSVNESRNPQGYKYVSNIKWLLRSNNEATLLANEKRVKEFIYEIAWLIKNYVMLHNPTLNFKVFATFPSSMKLWEKNKIAGMWRGAFNELLGAGNVTLVTDITESAAPFLYILSNEGAIASNYVNIDIGGGTTDIVYIDCDKKTIFADSSRFAGNDLWGDGVPKMINNLMNGFYLKMKTLVDNGTIALDDKEKEKFKQQQLLAKYSSDVMSYVFRNEQIYAPSTFLTNQKSLRAAMFTHFAAIIYHIAKTMQAKKMEALNLVVRFSGLGSKYLDMILPESEDKANVITEMFKSVGMNIGRIKVEPLKEISPKEVTARGAVIADDTNVTNLLNAYTGDNGRPEEVALNFDELTPITLDEMSNSKDKVVSEYLEFVNSHLTAGCFASYIRREYDVVFTTEFVNALKDIQKMGVGFMAMSEHAPDDSEDNVTESAFFWPLKETLVNASNT